MSGLRGLVNFLPEPTNVSVLDAILKFPTVSISGGGNFSSKAFILADIFKHHKSTGPILWVANDKTEQENIVRACEEWFPKEAEVFKIDPPGNDERAAKLHTLFCLKSLHDGDKIFLWLPIKC